MPPPVHPPLSSFPPSQFLGTGPATLSGGESSFDTQLLDFDGSGPLPTARWIGWRLRMLVLAALLGCIGVFALARALAEAPHIDAAWRSNAQSLVELMRSDEPALKRLQGKVLLGIIGGNQAIAPIDALVLQRSGRWIVGDAERERHIRAQERLAMAMKQPSLRFVFADGEATDVAPHARGYVNLGAMFWLLCAMGLVLYLIAMVVLLARPTPRNILYAVMALCQAGNLLFIGVESVGDLALPQYFAAWDLHARTAFDLLTAAAVAHALTLHPTPLPGSRGIALVAWVAAALLLGTSVTGVLPYAWWWTQSAILACGALAIGLLTWSHRIEPHPFAVLLRRFIVVALSTMALLTLAITAADRQPGLQHTVASVGAIVWYVFFASLLLLVPFLSRSQQLMREFSLLAGISTVATSLDLLFVAVFSLGQFASLTLSLFLSLGVYAGARQWLLNQVLGNNMLTTERMFEQLYRIARAVEAHPETTANQLSQLLRELFEPLEVLTLDRHSSRARVMANGSTLLVPVPDLGVSEVEAQPRSIVIRYAHRGRRLFTVEDARLTNRVIEQLRRAIAFDKAVEQGRSEERTRLAQDLHDDIGARLLTLMYKAQTPEMEDYVRHTLQDLKTLTRGLAASNHRLSHAAAEWKADLTQRLAVVHIELAWSMSMDDDLMLSVVQWSALTRVLRELVSNVIAHASATRVSISFTLERDQVDLIISDNGSGRNPRAWAHGLGLGGVRKRVKQLGGVVEWTEVAPHGIACRVRIRQLSQKP